MAKIILIAPPYLELYGRLSGAAGRYFPLGIGYIASYLRQYGKHDVSMFEMEAQNLSVQDMSNRIISTKPDIIGITCTTPNFDRAVEIAQNAKKISSAKIILGGVHASALPEFILKKYSNIIDCIIIGEGEATMLELVDAYSTNTEFKQIKSICYKDNDKIVLNQPRPFIVDLDSIPFPARDLIPQKLFAPNLHNARYHNCFSILTSRGCPFNCSFCASRIVSGTKYRMHSPEYVLSEMEMLKNKYNAKQLIITDDTFTIDRCRLEKICNEMINKRLNLSWFCFSQVNTVDKKILELMKKAGCYSVGFGIESANAKTLKKMGKHIDLQKAVDTIKLANKVGLKTQAFYIFGAADETKEDINRTIQFAKKANTTIVFFNMLVPFPGTDEFNHFFADTPLEKINWRNFVAIGEQCVLKNARVSPREIEKMMGNAYAQYYLHPARLLNVLRHIKTFYELLNYIKAALSLLSQIFTWTKKNTKQ